LKKAIGWFEALYDLFVFRESLYYAHLKIYLFRTRLDLIFLPLIYVEPLPQSRPFSTERRESGPPTVSLHVAELVPPPSEHHTTSVDCPLSGLEKDIDSKFFPPFLRLRSHARSAFLLTRCQLRCGFFFFERTLKDLHFPLRTVSLSVFIYHLFFC